jgi:hypothetical protein
VSPTMNVFLSCSVFTPPKESFRKYFYFILPLFNSVAKNLFLVIKNIGGAFAPFKLIVLPLHWYASTHVFIHMYVCMYVCRYVQEFMHAYITLPIYILVHTQLYLVFTCNLCIMLEAELNLSFYMRSE